MISRKDQLSPMHRHNIKAEDIINRGGGKLVLELFASAEDGSVDPSADVSVLTDGVERRFSAGGLLKLDPGESVTLLPGVWHAFWGEGSDEPIGRFSTIIEDEAPGRLLVSDYDTWL
mgnify:CR=1 FL=1